MTTLRKTLLFGGLLLVAAAVAAVVEPQLARPATPPASPATITVSGEGTAKAVPDRASFDFGVQTKGTTAATALSENSRQADAIVAALEKAGVGFGKPGAMPGKFYSFAPPPPSAVAPITHNSPM